MQDTVAHYRLVSKIGEGAMGVVYAADDQRLQRAGRHQDDNAARTLTRSRANVCGAKRRAAASVSHPNVCQLSEIGEADGELFIAMELLDGEPLQLAPVARRRCRSRRVSTSPSPCSQPWRRSRAEHRPSRSEAVECLSDPARRQVA